MDKKTGKYIVDIVPLTRIPLTRNQSFSYLHNEKLAPGTLVNIPLFRRKVEGIVLGSRSDFKRLGNIELKKVEKIIEEKFLTENQLKLAQFISDYYISPLGIVMKGLVPKRAKLRIKEQRTKNNKAKKIILTAEQKNAVDIISKFNPPAGGQNSKFLLYGPSGSGKTEIYIHSMLEIRKKDPQAQFLVLVPEQTLTPQAIERYGEYFPPEEIVILSSNTTRGQFYENWRRAKSGQAKIIIATRIGVFAPFYNLRLIVIDEEQDMSYKNWDMNPRYDARKVAEKLSELYKCSIVRGSATPGIETYHRALNGELRLIKAPLLELSSRSESKMELVDMKKERWQKNYSPISKKLKSEIAYALKNKLQTILLINRQGMSNFSVCESCKNVLRCPKCDRALLYDEKGYYRCGHCSYKTSITPQCPKCKSLVFKNIGLGTQKVEKEINDLFPEAKTARIDSQAIREKNYQQKIYDKFSKSEIDILIGTQMVSKGWDFPNVALVGIIDADNMLSVPDFSTGEKAYDLIVQISGRVSRPGSKFPGTVILQSYNPENKLLKLAAEKNYEEFYCQEIKERKMLALPPFGKIIKLTTQDYNRKKVENMSLSVYNMIKGIPFQMSISEPQEAFVSRIRGRYRKQIILKTTAPTWPRGIIKIIKGLPSGWIVDVDPISIL